MLVQNVQGPGLHPQPKGWGWETEATVDKAMALSLNREKIQGRSHRHLHSGLGDEEPAKETTNKWPSGRDRDQSCPSREILVSRQPGDPSFHPPPGVPTCDQRPENGNQVSPKLH